MKTTESKVRKIKIEEIDGLDPVSVYLEDFEPGKGKITISCYSQTWSSYWPAMGGTISEFFRRANNDYLSENLGGPNRYVVDEDKSKDWLKKELIQKRRNEDVWNYEAREMFEEIEGIEDPEKWAAEDGPLSKLLFEGEWWNADFPKKENPDYTYLCRIIDTVKEVLKDRKESVETVSLPKELTAENGAKALLIGEFNESVEIRNPEYCGDSCEITETSCHADTCNNCSISKEFRNEYITQKVPVSWTTIKEIYKKVVNHFQVELIHEAKN